MAKLKGQVQKFSRDVLENDKDEKEKTMKKAFLFGTTCMSLLVAVFIAAPWATAAGKTAMMSEKTYEAEHAADMRAMKNDKIFVMSGTLTAAVPEYNTAVIECPVGGQIFTVAGPLTQKAALKKGGKSAKLQDFKAGEKVKVKWQATENGHLILMLAAK